MANKQTKTQEEELEQTFGAYATEIPEEESFTKGNDKKEGKNKGSLAIIAGGVVMILGVIWFFVLPLFSGKPQPKPQVKPVANQGPASTPVEVPQNNVAVTAPVVEVAPVQVQQPQMQVQAPVVEVAPVQVQQPQVQVQVPVVEVQAPVVEVAPVQVQQPQVQVQTPVVEVAPIQVQQPQMQVQTPAQTEVVVNVPNVTDNGVSSMKLSSPNADLLDGIKAYFDSKLDNVNQNLDKQGKSIDTLQINFNKMNDRLTALEKGERKVIVRKVSAPVSSNNNVVVKKAETERGEKSVVTEEKERVIASKPVREVSSNGDDVLIVKKNAKAVNTNYKIHSLFNGRVWIENSDNTHSSYSVNDRLPNGEIIKSIDMEKDTITTDRGVLKNN